MNIYLPFLVFLVLFNITDLYIVIRLGKLGHKVTPWFFRRFNNRGYYLLVLRDEGQYGSEVTALKKWVITNFVCLLLMIGSAFLFIASGRPEALIDQISKHPPKFG